MPPRPRKPEERPRIQGTSVLFAPAAREALRRGLSQMAATMRPTLGPVARTVAIAPQVGTKPPEVLDRAAVIARRTVAIEGDFANMGAMLLRHAVWRVHEAVGDGGATTAVIAHRLLDGAIGYVGAGGDAVLVRRGIELAAEAALAELGRLARPIERPAEIAALVAGSLRSTAIAEMVGEAVEAVGPEGVVLVRDAPGIETACEYVEGVRWNAGLVSPHFLNGNATSAVVDHPLILVADFALTSAEDLKPALEVCLAAGERRLAIVAPEIGESALGLLLANRERGVLEGAVAVKGPTPVGQAERALEEVALIVGARCLSRARGDRPADLTIADLGRSRLLWATSGQTGIIGGRGERAAIRRRLVEVRQELERATDEDARGKIRDRLGRLANVAAIIRVGARTKNAQRELKERVEAAVAAGRAAARDGVVPGGGGALLAAIRAIDALPLRDDEAVGARLLARALEEPMRAIVGNAGLEAAPLLADARCRAPNLVYDVVHRTWVDPWSSGLLDPAAVVRRALTTSVSAATTALMTDVLVRSPQPAYSLEP